MKVKEFVEVTTDIEREYDIWFAVNNKIVLCIASTSENASPFVPNNFYMLEDVEVKEVIDEGNGLYLCSDTHIDAKMLQRCKHNK